MKDGVGERLITLNPATLNVPAFKNAGWGMAQDVRRTYSPPIPSGTTGEYFANTSAGKTLHESTAQTALQTGDDGILLGSHFSGDSQEGGARTPRPEMGIKSRTMHHREEDDSSDMSDDSDEDDQK